MMADILLRKNQTRAAIIEYQESLLLGADLDIAYLPLAQAYSSIMEYENVISLLTDTLNAKNNFEISILQAIAYENIERPKKALEKYEHALKLQPESITTLNNLASFYLRQDNIFQSNIFITKALNVDPRNAYAVHIKGQISEKEGHIQKALTLFKKAYIIVPTDPFISRSLANTYISLKQLDKARDVVDKILIVTPDEPFIMLLSARLYGMNDNNELAKKAYEEITKKMALITNQQLLKQSELLLVSGLALYMTGHYETARNKLINYVSQHPKSLYAIGILVDTHIKLDESKVALKVMEAHYDIIKSNLSLSLVMCDLYIQTNKIYQCERFISELRQTHNAKRVFDLVQVKILQARNKHQKALSYFEQHFTHTTGQEVKKVAVMLYLQNGQTKRALVLVNELIELSLTNSNGTYQVKFDPEYKGNDPGEDNTTSVNGGNDATFRFLSTTDYNQTLFDDAPGGVPNWFTKHSPETLKPIDIADCANEQSSDPSCYQLADINANKVGGTLIDWDFNWGMEIKLNGAGGGAFFDNISSIDIDDFGYKTGGVLILLDELHASDPKTLLTGHHNQGNCANNGNQAPDHEPCSATVVTGSGPEPVPEPSALALFGLGIFGTWYRSRKAV
jgi:tetratricopeptide (TPR) repeat protein